jgi:hypothetical protein
MHVSSRDAPQSLEFWEDGRQSGSYQFGNTSPWVLISRYFRIAGNTAAMTEDGSQ